MYIRFITIIIGEVVMASDDGTNTKQAFNMREGVVVTDYNNPNEVYMKLYGVPAPYVGAEGKPQEVFKNTGMSYESAQATAKALDTVYMYQKAQDVANSQSTSQGQNGGDAHFVSADTVIGLNGGLRLPSGDRVSGSDISAAYKALGIPQPVQKNTESPKSQSQQSVSPPPQPTPSGTQSPYSWKSASGEPITLVTDPMSGKLSKDESKELSNKIYANPDQYKKTANNIGGETIYDKVNKVYYSISSDGRISKPFTMTDNGVPIGTFGSKRNMRPQKKVAAQKPMGFMTAFNAIKKEVKKQPSKPIYKPTIKQTLKPKPVQDAYGDLWSGIAFGEKKKLKPKTIKKTNGSAWELLLRRK